MKIYNEVISYFNELSGQWETTYEDSYDYNGEIALAQGLPPNATAISAQDTVADTIKTTAGYFTNGDGTLLGSEVHTGSLSATNEKYYFNVAQAHEDSSSAEVQFSVTYGHINGSGSDTYGDSTTNPSNIVGQAQAVYKQYTNLLIEETEASGGFKIAANGSSLPVGKHAIAAGEADEFVYIWNGRRERFKDRVNKKAWTLVLSGSTSEGTTAQLSITDDSAYQPATATPGGPRYNIISGALGVRTGSSDNPASHKTYGWFYPEMSIMVFSGAQLSASIPGYSGSQLSSVTAYNTRAQDAAESCSGFAPNLTNSSSADNALRFVNCMRAAGSNTWRLRSEEDQTQENYFCRIRANDYNFSANPTFVSGALNKIRHTTMHGNPTTFITGVGLYNSSGQLLATAKLSSPLKKNFASEATVKVKLTY